MSKKPVILARYRRNPQAARQGPAPARQPRRPSPRAPARRSPARRRPAKCRPRRGHRRRRGSTPPTGRARRGRGRGPVRRCSARGTRASFTQCAPSSVRVDLPDEGPRRPLRAHEGILAAHEVQVARPEQLVVAVLREERARRSLDTRRAAPVRVWPSSQARARRRGGHALGRDAPRPGPDCCAIASSERLVAARPRSRRGSPSARRRAARCPRASARTPPARRASAWNSSRRSRRSRSRSSPPVRAREAGEEEVLA